MNYSLSLTLRVAAVVALGAAFDVDEAGIAALGADVGAGPSRSQFFRRFDKLAAAVLFIVYPPILLRSYIYII